jgi:hypothetical protein
MVYVVTYHPKLARRNAALIQTVRNFEGYALLTDYSFLVRTKWSASFVRDRIKQNLRVGDELFVCKLEKSAAWTGFDAKFSQWIKNAFD